MNMNMDLEEIFDAAGHDAPPPTFDADRVIRRGRWVRTRRRAVAGTAMVGLAAAGVTGVILVTGSAPRHGATPLPPAASSPSASSSASPSPSASSSASPSPSAPSPTPSPTGSPTDVGPNGVSLVTDGGGTPPLPLQSVSLPAAVPGFPLKPDPADSPDWYTQVDPNRDGKGPTYWELGFTRQAKPDIVKTDVQSGDNRLPTGRYLNVTVGEQPVSWVRQTIKEDADRTPVEESVQVLGVPGHVLRYTHKGSPYTLLYFEKGGFTVEVIVMDNAGARAVSTDDLVTVAQTITGLDGSAG